MIDLDRYFERIGYEGGRTPSLDVFRAIHRAQALHVPFENIDIRMGRRIALDPDALFEKIVTRRRGGYCFELNGILQHVLRALGFDVTPLAARVIYSVPPDMRMPKTHMLMLVDVDGERWLGDVGFGAFGLVDPIPFVIDRESESGGETFRIRGDGAPFFMLEARVDGAWNDIYEFTLEPQHDVDYRMANWYTSTSPDSRFTQRLVVTRNDEQGRRWYVAGDYKNHRRGGERSEKKVEGTELASTLREEFGIELDADEASQLGR